MTDMSEVESHGNVTCKMDVAERCRAEPLACVAGADVGGNADWEGWCAGFLSSAIGPRDRRNEIRAPAVGMFLCCYHPGEPNEAVWNALQEQLELHHPGQCCAYCRRSWHHVLTVCPDTGVASKLFSVILPLDEVHPLLARLGGTHLQALLERAHRTRRVETDWKVYHRYQDDCKDSAQMVGKKARQRASQPSSSSTGRTSEASGLPCRHL